MAELSLERCDRCQFATGDVTPSRNDGVPRCPPCERRADHERRLAYGDSWYRDVIARFAAATYGAGWEQDPGFDHCAEAIADARALGGWHAIGVDPELEFGPRRGREIATRPCSVCGETTSSVSNYMCAGCHFDGWWGQWRDRERRRPAA